MKMNSIIVLVAILLASSCVSATEHSLCFIHIGEKAPPGYLVDAVKQARLFNDDCPIYVGISRVHHERFEAFFEGLNVTLVALENLTRSPEHERFFAQTELNKQQINKRNNGLWLYAKERFIYLYEIAKEYNLKHIFHLENDNMLYVDLKELLPHMKAHYPGMGITFDNDSRSIPGFVYAAHTSVLQSVSGYIAEMAVTSVTDMGLFPLYKKEYPAMLHQLPIIMEDYAHDFILKSRRGYEGKNPAHYYNNCDTFGAIFDAAAIGQYLDGTYKHRMPGYENGSCVFRPSRFTYAWEIDEKGRRVPFVLYNNKKYRINNLHIHSKQLHKFLSIPESTVQKELQ